MYVNLLLFIPVVMYKLTGYWMIILLYIWLSSVQIIIASVDRFVIFSGVYI